MLNAFVVLKYFQYGVFNIALRDILQLSLGDIYYVIIKLLNRIGKIKVKQTAASVGNFKKSKGQFI